MPIRRRGFRIAVTRHLLADAADWTKCVNRLLVAAQTLMAFVAIACAPMHGSLQDLRQERPAAIWCSWAPPRSYMSPAINVDAPYSKWELNQCFFDSRTKCELALEGWRWRAQWRIWFPEKLTTGVGCSMCNRPPRYTYEQELEMWREREDASICMALDDPRIQDTDNIREGAIF
jgi:hypothetical protein